MPSFYEKPAAFGNAVVEDVDRFQQLDFYLVHNEVAIFQRKNIFDQLLGDIDWQANEGNIMRGTTPQGSPVGDPFFFPNDVTEVPNKDVYQVTESIEQARVKTHDFESFQFNFLPSFTAFWKNYLQFADKDIVEKIAVRNNQFIETNLWFLTPNVYFAGTGLNPTGIPTAMGNNAGTAADSKTNAWLVAQTQLYAIQGMTLRDMWMVNMNLQEDMGAPQFSGAKNMAKDNEGLKNKYVTIISSELFGSWAFDPDVQTLKPLDLNLLFNDFKGMLFGTITTKINPYPIRFSLVPITDTGGTVLWAAGQPIDPEIFDSTDQKRKPNPYYTSLVSAPYEVGHILGDSVARTVKVGPPPKEFATVNMSAEKFYSMKWNGEVRLTDQVLIYRPDGTIDLNTYGKQLKFISECTYGYLPGERRFSISFVYERRRPYVLTGA
jgi:hypothetical protein